jgi:hypothetical protein
MRLPILFLSALLVGAWGAGETPAAPVIYSDEAAFKARLLIPKTYDFEVASGFPEPSYGVFPYIGLHDNIQFDASTYYYDYPEWWPSTGTMTGKNDSFASATITFNEPPQGCGFIGLDLMTLDDEVIRTTFTFASGAVSTYDVRLPQGTPNFTPVFFGLVDTEDRVVSVNLYGWDATGIYRAWLIDNLTIGTDATPTVPVTWGRQKAMWR